MKIVASTLLLGLALIHSGWVQANDATPFSFGVIAKPVKANDSEAALREAITESDADNLAFVVASGLKAAEEPCSDALYRNRKTILDSAKNGVVLAVSGDDWTRCVNTKNRLIANDRMNRLRELLFTDEFSFGDSKIPVVRQSMMSQFRSYAENMRWRIGDVMFATINVPSNNNNYLNAAGHNTEFEDRQTANSDWLKRLFITAKISKVDGIVIFCDGNPLLQAEHSSMFSSGKREGYADLRRQILAFAEKYRGKILIVHSDYNTRPTASPKGISWRGNIGALRVEPPWRKIHVNPTAGDLFTLVNPITVQAAHH
ncbi:hypothetical protein ACFQPC_07600 [Herminiimonas glaciei]|uniref:Transmembrane protein n=1 Tax=Herminiimonas glaciei TaxID=523788 RepID=A0ABW2IA24_9BURK